MRVWLGYEYKVFYPKQVIFFSIHVFFLFIFFSINNVKKTLKRSYEIVKGGEFFFSEKRQLKRGIIGMKIWVQHKIVWKCARQLYLPLLLKYSLMVENLLEKLTKKRRQAFYKLIDVHSGINALDESISSVNM